MKTTPPTAPAFASPVPGSRWCPLSAGAGGLFAALLLVGSPVKAGNTWDGGGSDNNWGTGANWNPDSAPAPGTGNDLYFAGTTRLTPNNNYSAFDDFRNLIFNSGAGSFNITGNSLDLFGKIENNSTNLQTISITSFSMNSSSGSELDPTLGDLTLSLTGSGNNIFNSGNTIHVYGNTAHTLTLSTGTVITGSGGFYVHDNSHVIFNSAQTYSGTTAIDAGTLTTANTFGNNTGAVFIGNGGTGTINGGLGQPLYANTNAALILSASGSNLGNAITTNKADTGSGLGSGTRIIRTTYGSGSSTLSGTLTLNGGVVFDIANGGTLSHTNTIQNGSDSGFTSRTLTKTGNGTLSLTGTNTYTGATSVTGGTLQVGGSGSLTATASLSVSNAGTLLLAGGSEKLNNSAGLTLNGGTLRFADTITGATETLASLTLTANSTLDFGTHASGANRFIFTGGISGLDSYTLTINHWTGPVAGTAQDFLVYGTTNLNATQLGNIRFYDDANVFLGTGQQIAFGTPSYQVVPVPEPAPILGALALLALAAYRERHRFATRRA